MQGATDTATEQYSAVLNNLRMLAEKKKASALLPVMRKMTKYLHKADYQLIDTVMQHILVLVYLKCGILNVTATEDPHRKGR